MATNEHFRVGKKISLPVPNGTTAGSPLRINTLNCVAETDVAKTDVAPTNADGTRNASYNWGGGNVTGNASCWLDGAHDFTVSFAAAIGDTVYITSGNALSATATSNSVYGKALSAKGATAGPLTVLILN